MNWVIGPWIWLNSRWQPPSGYSALDLRSIEQQSTPGGTPGISLFFGSGSLSSDYKPIGEGSWEDIKPSGANKDVIPVRSGYSLKGVTLREMVLDLLTDGADPYGHESAKPIIPTTAGLIQLQCGQKYQQRFAWGSGHTGLIQDVIRHDFDGIFDAARKGELKDAEHHRRVLDYLCKKHQISDWKEFVHRKHHNDIPGILPHETTITDDFTRADSTSLIGNTLTWTQVSGTWGTTSNRGYKVASAGNEQVVRAESALSSADHYAQCNVSGTSTTYAGPACRFNASANTCYYTGQYSGNQYISKNSAGTPSFLGNVSHTFSSGQLMKVEANGSTIACYGTGSLIHSLTDTSITGNLYTGMMMFENGTSNYLDNFQAADLSAATSRPIFGNRVWRRWAKRTA